MKLKVVRKYFGAATAGKLYVDGRFFCYTLEDKIRPAKIKGETAIPYGTYQVLLTHSPKFGKVVPLISDVPGFSGIRIHPGNTTADTEGCLLVGDSLSEDKTQLSGSRTAYDRLYLLLSTAKEPIEITFTYEEIETTKKFFFLIVVVAVVATIAYIITNKDLKKQYT